MEPRTHRKGVGLHACGDSSGNAAMSGRVWVPESSLTDCNTLPHTEKREKAKIVRRTTPTVEIPIRCGKNDNEKIKSASQNYSTIEKNSYKKNSASLGLESGSSGLNTAARPHYNPEFCGWETDVGPRSVQTSSSTLKKCASERGYLSTPADGYRSGIPSRACSRAVGRRDRNNYYEFKHVSVTRDYIADYCCNYSYTALSLPKKTVGIDYETSDDMERCVCRRDEGGRGLSGRSAVHRGGEKYLYELATRLGVGGRSSVPKKQLCHLPQPTPPSFTKRNRVAANLLVSTQDERFTLQENQESSNPTPVPPEDQSSEVASRVVLATQDMPHTTAGSLELPTMPAKNNKTLSTTSVGKYFTINSRPPYSLGLGEEESAMDVSSHGSSGDTGSDGTLKGAEVKMTNKPTASKVGVSLVAKSSKSGQQPLIFDDSHRERVLSQKAQALGLVSRDWTHISPLKRTVSDQTHTSLPQTKKETIGYRHTLNTTSSDRDHSLRKGEKRDLTMSRLSEKATGRNSKGKLDKLRSIYEPEGGLGRQQTGRQRCVTRRPATRCSNVEYDQRDRGHIPKYLSRPSTKLSKKMRPALQCEESQYWNEVPNRGHSHFPTQTGTRTGICLRVDLLRSSTDSRPAQNSMDCRPLQSSMDCRPPQNIKAYLKAQTSSQYPPSHQMPLAAKIDLSGNNRSNGVLSSQSPTHKLLAFSRKTRKRSLVETRTNT